MKIVFIGTVEFSRMTLEKIYSFHKDIVGICTLKESNFNSDFSDLSIFGNSKNIPCKYVNDINSTETLQWIKEKSPDVIFCFGWSRLLKEELLNLPPLGVIGYHPAALPLNRGRHPLIWALVLGLDKTASTFFFMDDRADNGDILSQREILILEDDDASSLYKKIVEAALVQIEEFVPQLIAKNFPRLKQNHKLSNTWRKRGIADGKIDWRMSAKSIHNLVRGLTRPYVGAHFTFQGSEIKVWKTEVVKCKNRNIEPGKVINEGSHKHPIIKCGEDSISLISIEPSLKIEKGTYL